MWIPSAEWRSMGLELVPSKGTITARVDGVTIRNVNDSIFRDIEAALNEYGVLIFPGQFLSQEEQVNFALRFGELDRIDTRTPGNSGKCDRPVILELSNVDENGIHITDPHHPRTRNLGGNEGWHSDSSFKAGGATASILAALETPSKGGETEFADVAAAYDALDPAVQLQLAGLEVWHSIAYSQAVVNAIDVAPAADPLSMPGARKPLVIRHPATGRNALLIGRHACYVFGMSVTAGQELLEQLLADACQVPRLYEHRWTAGDVVVWDNRRVLHRARKWDLAERRVMRHVRTREPGGAGVRRGPMADAL